MESALCNPDWFTAPGDPLVREQNQGVLHVPSFCADVLARFAAPSRNNNTSLYSLHLSSLPLMSRILQLYVGWSFHVGAFKALRRGRANMDVLVSGGSLASYVYSLISVFHRYRQWKRGVHAAEKDYFETAALLITFLSLGKLLEVIAKGKTSEVSRLHGNLPWKFKAE